MLKQMLLVIMAGALVVGCDRSETTSSSAAPEPSAKAQATTLPAGLVLASAPAGAKTVKEVRASAKDGDEVVVRGVIAGRVDPIAENRAILTLLDPAMKTCNQLPGDQCKTPWDACCEQSEDIAANSATVQVVDEKGTVVKMGLASIAGIKPLKEVVVKGKLKLSPDGKAAVVDATGLYVTP